MPAGWVKRDDAPSAFNVAEAFLALISGEPDNWLREYVYLIGGTVIDTAYFCANVDLTPPSLELSDFVGLVPTSVPNLLGIGINAAETMYGLRDKLAAYAIARIGSAYCQGPGVSGSACYVFAQSATAGVGGWFYGDGERGYPIPAGQGIDSMKVEILSCADGYNDVHMAGWRDGVLVAEGNPSAFDGVSVGTVCQSSFVGDVNEFSARANGSGPITARLSWCGAALDAPSTTNTVAPAPPVDGLPPPPSGAYPDIPSLGAELDNLERKLELVRDMVLYLVQQTAPPAVESGDPVDAAGDTVIPAVGAIGAIVTFAMNGMEADLSYGAPQRYYHIGRVTVGTKDGWLPPVELDVSPMLIAPFPPTVSKVQVAVVAPITAAVTLLYPPKQKPVAPPPSGP